MFACRDHLRLAKCMSKEPAWKWIWWTAFWVPAGSRNNVSASDRCIDVMEIFCMDLCVALHWLGFYFQIEYAMWSSVGTVFFSKRESVRKLGHCLSLCLLPTCLNLSVCPSMYVCFFRVWLGRWCALSILLSDAQTVTALLNHFLPCVCMTLRALKYYVIFHCYDTTLSSLFFSASHVFLRMSIGSLTDLP